MSKLVIVESPAKAKTIKKYLGKDYDVIASMGHVRDLPKEQFAIDIENGFKPRYINVQGKSALIKELKAQSEKADEVYLATDPDREGEAIAWHLANLLKLDISKENRVTFDEITKNGIVSGMNSKRKIDLALFDAQEARRVLDRIVGYRLSPFLWEKIKGGLSAGRVQSVAVKLVVDRHREIESFIPSEYWNIDAVLSSGAAGKKFRASFALENSKKINVTNERKAAEIKEKSLENPFVVKSITYRDRRRVPAPPFTTSSMQQEASRRLGFTSRRTMRAAQTLYEGVEVEGFGSLGLITYMRTDSLRISEEAYYSARDYIKEKFGRDYAPAYRRNFKTKGKAQDAHEAIRPTNISITPEIARDSLSPDTAKLYRLIWERFVASQMSDSIQKVESVDISCGNYIYRASGYNVVFEGFTVLYEEANDEKKEKETALPELSEGETLKAKEIVTEQKFTLPPNEYTEATLIKALEENGIGRPSTYAPTISTILDRNYVERDGKKIVPTELGITVNDLLQKEFANTVNIDFTTKMENDLDRIGEGSADKLEVLTDFYNTFSAELEKAKNEMEGQKIKVPEVFSDEKCPVCGKPLVIKSGRYGKFLACSGFPECRYTRKIVVYAKGTCPVCGGKIQKLKSKKGRVFYACENSKTCSFMSWEEPTDSVCPECGKTMFRRSSKAKPHCVNPECSAYVPFADNTRTRKTAKNTRNKTGAKEDNV